MQTFLGVPNGTAQSLRPGAVGIIGAADSTPYEAGKPSHSQDGPAAIRAASQRYAGWQHHYDCDTGHVLVDPGGGAVVDLGDEQVA